jgi:hypothetical protein
MTFRVGQKVVCVEPHDNPPASGGVVAGKAYTIRELGVAVSNVLGVRLYELEFSCGPREIGCISRKSFKDAFIRANRFRPLVERKTDISALKALLVPGAKIRETA